MKTAASAGASTATGTASSSGSPSTAGEGVSSSRGFEPKLRVRVRHRRRIAAGEARAAELRLGPSRRGDEPIMREIRERRCADVLAALLDRLARGDHLRLIRAND